MQSDESSRSVDRRLEDVVAALHEVRGWAKAEGLPKIAAKVEGAISELDAIREARA